MNQAYRLVLDRFERGVAELQYHRTTNLRRGNVEALMAACKIRWMHDLLVEMHRLDPTLPPPPDLPR